MLSSREILPLDEDAARRAGEMDGSLRVKGAPLDPEDGLSAGTALARGEPVLMKNARHFGRVAGLSLETY